MAKFCKKCGRMANDTDQVCPQCGTPLEAPQKDAADRLFAKIAVVVAAVIVLALVVNIISVNTGYHAAVKKMVKYFQNNKVEKLIDMASSYSEEWYEVWGDDFEEYCENYISSQRDYMEDTVGSIKKISCSINSADKMSKEDLEELEESLEEYAGDDARFLAKSAYRVYLTLTVKGSKETKDYYTSILVVKENGKWKLAYSL